MKEDKCNNILAKPSGITLGQHRSDVVSEVSDICQIFIGTCEKYKKLTGKDLAMRLSVSAKWHDNGKACPKWQEACRKDFQSYQLWKHNHPTCSFKEYSSEKRNEAGYNLRTVGIRHEFYSLKEAVVTNMPIPILAAIAAHHGKLGLGFEDKWTSCPSFKQFWNEFRKTSNDISEKESLALVCDKLLEFDTIRGLLQFADHRASAKEDKEPVPGLNCFNYRFPFENKRGIQKLVEDNWNNDILLVRAPTGAGKTDASLLWASRQIAVHKADRLVIAMPTRFTANALSVNVAATLSDTGLYHSSAWYSKYSKVQNGELDMKEALAQQKMANLLATPITVCTIDHLLMSLTFTQESHHLICSNLANSCVVIDEADFYDDFTLANIIFLLKVLHNWKVPVMIMSASLPESALQLYRKAGFNIESILEDKESDSYNKCFNIKKLIEYDDIQDINYLLKYCIERGNAIIYLNTVDKAIKVYKEIKALVLGSGKDIPIILYHSRFTEKDKQRKENMLLDNLGRKAWNNGTAKGIAILTQIGEISINISSELMISEICPIDRLMQRAGRLCRFDNSVGEMYALIPYKDNTLYPAPYGSYSQNEKSWIPCKALLSTIDILKAGIYSAQDLVNILNKVYSEEAVFSIKAQTNVQALEQMLINNWLMNPVEKWNDDDTHSNSWRSRDIGPQGLVFVIKPACTHFYNYSEYMEFVLSYSISLPVYLLDKGRKEHRIDSDCKITIGSNDSIFINVIRDGFYTFDIGVDLTNNEEDNFL